MLYLNIASGTEEPDHLSVRHFSVLVQQVENSLLTIILLMSSVSATS
ncbi:hypothetical protein Pan161_31870 [Gimesia algae]|uniref:Uncharacterized protein n=1 Tax=Gimesia algae TaxID=2527971 RepID=A0A517VET9_9PLAN|nr:hypothetical protein Pan161_31870 [Gimesia algae]